MPKQYKILRTSFSESESKLLQNEIEKLLQLKLTETEQYISPIFLRPKKDGNYRLILNLKKSTYPCLATTLN